MVVHEVGTAVDVAQEADFLLDVAPLLLETSRRLELFDGNRVSRRNLGGLWRKRNCQRWQRRARLPTMRGAQEKENKVCPQCNGVEFSEEEEEAEEEAERRRRRMRRQRRRQKRQRRRRRMRRRRRQRKRQRRRRKRGRK